MTTQKGARSLAHRIEYWAFRLYWRHLTGMGIEAASNAGGRFLRAIGPLTPSHRTAKLNMRLAFPRLTGPEERELLDEMWDGIGRLAGEFVQMHRLDLFQPESPAPCHLMLQARIPDSASTPMAKGGQVKGKEGEGKKGEKKARERRGEQSRCRGQ